MNKSMFVEVVSDRRRIGYFYAGIYVHQEPIGNDDTYIALTWDNDTIYFMDLIAERVLYETNFGALLIEKAMNQGAIKNERS